ncbi:MAG: LUD domain-containing protein, partial [Candidatus Magasanikiibacteriota bacterium]
MYNKTEIHRAFDQVPDDQTINKTTQALLKNNIKAFVAENKKEAKEMVLKLIPKGSMVMNMTSVTVDSTGLSDQINSSIDYQSVRKAMDIMAENDRQIEKLQLGAVHKWTVGSVHAVTEDGQVCVASATGSQLPAYSYGADNVIWVVGAQKIVKNLDEAMKRINNYVFPLENERALKVYGAGSGVN